jgi:hypothetical protein
MPRPSDHSSGDFWACAKPVGSDTCSSGSELKSSEFECVRTDRYMFGADKTLSKTFGQCGSTYMEAFMSSTGVDGRALGNTDERALSGLTGA